MLNESVRSARMFGFAAFFAGMVVLWPAIFLSLDAAHERVVERVTTDQRNLARSLAENVGSSFRALDLSLLHLRDGWVRDRGGFADIVAREVDFLKRESIEQVSVIDANGQLVWSNLPGWRPVDLSDRAHFKVHKSGVDVMQISEPVIGRNSQQLSLRFTRPIFDRDGRFAGVMGIAVPPLALEKIYNDIKLAEGGNISLVRADGRFLARSRNFSEASKRVLPVETTPGLRPNDPVSNTTRRISNIDREDSFVSYYKVADYPAVVFVRESADALLGGYYVQRLAYCVAGALVTILAGWLALLLIMKARNQEHAELNSAHLAAIIESANDAIIGRSLDGKITSWNAAAARMFGYTFAEIRGTSGALTPPELAHETERNRNWIAKGKAIPEYETVRLAKDGHRLDVSVSVSLIKNARGEIVGMAHIVRDISERKRAEEARARLAAIIESASDAIIGRTPDGKVTSWNAAAERMFGYTIEEINGRADLLTPPDKLNESVSNRALIKAGKAIEAYETVRLTKDGRRIDVLLSGSPIKNERGEIIGMANILRDITEQKMIHEAMRFLAEHSARHEALDLFKPLTRYLSGALGAEMTCVIRLENDAIHARTIAVYADGDHRDNTSYALAGTPCAELIKTESVVFPHDVRALFPNDEPLQQFGAESYIGVTLWGASRAPIGLIVAIGRKPLANVQLAESILKLVAVRAEGELERELIVDALRKSEGDLATLNAQLEANVERRTADLRVTNEELESFSYSVAHDLRAPLRAIGGFSAIVLGHNEDKLDSTSVNQLRRIKTNAERMAELIDDLLSLTRVSRQQIHRIDLDLSAVAKGVADALAEAQPQRSVEVVIAPGMIVHADAGLVRVLFDNLIGNAWKFTAVTQAARIEVGSEAHAGETAYYVRDNGAGFDMTYVNKLFSPFQRLHGREEFEGTGIGLSIVRRIVMKHGGSARAEGRVGHGATIYFTFGKPPDSEPARV